ncbi:hypothetical protein [Salibacterium qingdaonense]|nr:hypothetical protein [Salibacterium qingdaonense]
MMLEDVSNALYSDSVRLIVHYLFTGRLKWSIDLFYELFDNHSSS